MDLHEFIHAPAVTCSPDLSLADAATLMDLWNVGSVIVVDSGAHVVGILTDRDIAVRGVANHHPPETPVWETMTKSVATVREDAELFDAARQMAETGCRRMPVVAADGTLKGVIALDDLVGLFARQTDNLAHAVAFESAKVASGSPIYLD
jgi:signal-transduction protein with cAMP-binding, CBS, and nucleotidyltransferase domain